MNKIITTGVCAILLTTIIAGCASKTTKTTDPKLTLADATFPPSVTAAATKSPTKDDTYITDYTDGISVTDAEITGDDTASDGITYIDITDSETISE